MDIQTEVQKIHHKFGVTEKANYEIQKLFEKLILEDRAKQLRLGAVSNRRELLSNFSNYVSNKYNLNIDIDDTDVNDYMKISNIVNKTKH